MAMGKCIRCGRPATIQTVMVDHKALEIILCGKDRKKAARENVLAGQRMKGKQ